VDGDTLSVSGVTQGANGTVTINPDGTVTYALPRFFGGTDTFTYTVSDGHGGTATAVVTVDVQVPPAQGIEMVQSQVNGHTLNTGEKNSLSSKLAAATQSLAQGNSNAAVNQLSAFIHQMTALANAGRLDLAIAQELIEEIQVVIALIA
jgi:hypothetical protein